MDLALPFRLSLVEVGCTLVNRGLQRCDVGLEALILFLQLLKNMTITNYINIIEYIVHGSKNSLLKII